MFERVHLPFDRGHATVRGWVVHSPPLGRVTRGTIEVYLFFLKFPRLWELKSSSKSLTWRKKKNCYVREPNEKDPMV